MPIGQVNLHSATTEQLLERLAWFYTTAKQMTFFDADGYQTQNIEFDKSLTRMHTIADELCAKVQL